MTGVGTASTAMTGSESIPALIMFNERPPDHPPVSWKSMFACMEPQRASETETGVETTTETEQRHRQGRTRGHRHKATRIPTHAERESARTQVVWTDSIAAGGASAHKGPSSSSLLTAVATADAAASPATGPTTSRGAPPAVHAAASEDSRVPDPRSQSFGSDE